MFHPDFWEQGTAIGLGFLTLWLLIAISIEARGWRRQDAEKAARRRERREDERHRESGLPPLPPGGNDVAHPLPDPDDVPDRPRWQISLLTAVLLAGAIFFVIVVVSGTLPFRVVDVVVGGSVIVFAFALLVQRTDRVRRRKRVMPPVKRSLPK